MRVRMRTGLCLVGIEKMITVFGEGRGFRVVWLLEEMGLPYRLRPVDLAAGVQDDTEFLDINPGGFIPAMRDGDVVMVESIAIMEYLQAYMARLSERDAFKRALETCRGTGAWIAASAG